LVVIMDESHGGADGDGTPSCSADDWLPNMDNVIVTSHALCWADDFTREVATSVIDHLCRAGTPARRCAPLVFAKLAP
jgi:hypothetical protein